MRLFMMTVRIPWGIRLKTITMEFDSSIPDNIQVRRMMMRCKQTALSRSAVMLQSFHSIINHPFKYQTSHRTSYLPRDCHQSTWELQHSSWVRVDCAGPWLAGSMANAADDGQGLPTLNRPVHQVHFLPTCAAHDSCLVNLRGLRLIRGLLRHLTRRTIRARSFPCGRVRLTALCGGCYVGKL